MISREELQELKNDLTKVKETGRKEVETTILQEKKMYEEKLDQSLNIQSLKHEAETAMLRASAESHQKEVANFNSSLARMAEELKSQKELTASMVAPRPLTNTTQ